MDRTAVAALIVAALAGTGTAQDFLIGGPTPGGHEPLYSYDDLEPWKHGWIQEIPFYGGYHSYRPYNYKHVYAQAAQAEAWSMPRTMPYSQQYYHRYEQFNGESFPVNPHRPAEMGSTSSYRDPARTRSWENRPVVTTGYDPRQSSAFPRPVDRATFEEATAMPTIAPKSDVTRFTATEEQGAAVGESNSAPTYEPLFIPDGNDD